MRAKAIAVFFAIAQCFGALGPVIYGALIGDGSQPFKLFLGYLFGAVVMIAGGLVAVVFGWRPSAGLLRTSPRRWRRPVATGRVAPGPKGRYSRQRANGASAGSRQIAGS